MHIPEKYNQFINGSKNYTGLMGISAGKPAFSNRKIMKRYIDFMQEQFLESYFLIADSPKRHNIMGMEGVSEEEAMRRADITGYDTLRFMERLVIGSTGIKIKRWRDFSNHQFYTSNLDILNRSYSENNSFKEECNQLVLAFLSNQNNNPNFNASISREEKVSKCSKYLLEELAMLLALPAILERPLCEIYPGTNKVQEKLQQRQFPFANNLHMRDDRRFVEVYY